AESENTARLAAISTRVADIDKELAAKFPDYAALVNPTPLSVEEVQKQLGPDEAMILFLDTPELKPTPEETFIWVVTKTGEPRWVRSDLGTTALIRQIAALRCGLDSSNWIDARSWREETEAEQQRKSEQQARRARCQELVGREGSDGELLPFDLGRAHDLYQ